MTVQHYILDESGQNIVAVGLFTWADWFETRQKGVVKQDRVGRSFISTVFMGINYGWEDGPPVLWESMVFRGKLDQERRRCSGGREQAEAMHAKIVMRVQKAERLWLWLPRVIEFWFDQFYDLAFPIQDWRMRRERQQSLDQLRKAMVWLRESRMKCATT